MPDRPLSMSIDRKIDRPGMGAVSGTGEYGQITGLSASLPPRFQPVLKKILSLIDMKVTHLIPADLGIESPLLRTQ